MLLVALFIAAAKDGACQEKESVTFSGYIDTNIAHDFNHLPKLDRPYTTQPYFTYRASLNLGYVDATIDNGHRGEKINMWNISRSPHAINRTRRRVLGTHLPRYVHR